MRYIIRLSYDGSGFSGWQRQNNATTVQGETERALSILFGEEVSVTGAGRTDTDVNAINYMAHFEISESKPLTEPAHFICKINAILPRGIMVHEIKPAPGDFHARFSATSREYHYFLHRKKDPFMGRFSWYCKYPLDVDAMNRAAAMLLGEHDFRCFEKNGGNNLTSICTVTEAVWTTWTPPHADMLGYPCADGDCLVFRIRANRFLRNMVRAIVGTLVDIGRGRHDEEWIGSLLRNGTRSDAGESVPGHALFLSGVEYPCEDGCRR